MDSIGAFPCGEIDSFTVSEFLDHSLFHGDGFSPSLEAEIEIGTAKTLNESLACYVHNTLQTNSSNAASHHQHEVDHIASLPPCFLTEFNQISGHNNVFFPADMFMGIATPHVAEMCTEQAEDRATSFRETPMKRKFDMPEKHVLDNKRIQAPRDVGSEGQSSCSYSSEEENVGQEMKRGSAANANGKARAARGGATDPQSLYARKRRERINERLRILQNLVPNGTKVDISTMLEEAVHYVKFLQLQIKLLSSNDMWMYAPLAYNGFDMGLHMKIFSQFTRQ